MSNAWLFIAKLFEAMHCIYLKQYVVKQNVPKDPHTWSGPGSGTARNPRTNNAMYSCFNNHLVLNRDLITWVIDPLFLHFRKIYEMWWFWFSFTHKGTALIPAIACGTAFGIWGIPLTVEPAVVISVSDSGGETAGSVFCKKGVTQGVTEYHRALTSAEHVTGRGYSYRRRCGACGGARSPSGACQRNEDHHTDWIRGSEKREMPEQAWSLPKGGWSSGASTCMVSFISKQNYQQKLYLQNL